MFGEMVAYKAAWAGKRVIMVPAAYSSQECARCGHVDARNRPEQAKFACLTCGHQDHADVNAARVIRARGIQLLNTEGLSVSACGEFGVGRSMKQEETAGIPGGQDQTSSDVRLPAH